MSPEIDQDSRISLRRQVAQDLSELAGASLLAQPAQLTISVSRFLLANIDM